MNLAFLALAVSSLAMARPHPEQIIAYVFPQNAVIEANEIDAAKLTRINYAFANIRDGQIVEGFSNDAKNFAVLRSLRASNPGLEILVSVGGWGWSGGFSDMANTPESRARFIDSAVLFIGKYQLDGLDIDWEYPGLPGAGNKNRPEDKQNYTTLLKELQQRFRRERPHGQRHLLLSIAAGAAPDFLAHTQMSEVANFVDTVNLMSYDYYEPTDDKVAGHHAALFANPADPKHLSAEKSVNAFLAAGVPPNKLVLGVPFYGHAWTAASGTNFGLYQPGRGALDFPSSFRALQVLLSAPSDYVRHWDEQSSVPYLYNAKTATFISYEDEQSLAAKCTFVLGRHLAGIMFWDYESDANGRLLTTIHDELTQARSR